MSIAQGQDMCNNHEASMVLCAAGESSQFAILGRTAQILAKTALLGETSTWSSQPPQYLPPPVLLSYYKQHVDLVLIFAMQAHQNSLKNLFLIVMAADSQNSGLMHRLAASSTRKCNHET
jgi:hypothetical protein